MPRGRLRALNPRKCQSIFRISGREVKFSSPQHPNKAGHGVPGVLLPSQPRTEMQMTVDVGNGKKCGERINVEGQDFSHTRGAAGKRYERDEQ